MAKSTRKSDGAKNPSQRNAFSESDTLPDRDEKLEVLHAHPFEEDEPIDELLPQDGPEAPSEDELDDELDGPTGGDDQIDDPIRIYLMQMGEIPLLDRHEEIESAKKIERSRKQFRHVMLSTDYMLQATIGMLEKVCEGKLRLDRTVEVSVTNIREKRHIMGVLQPNLATLRQLLARNQEDFSIAISRSRPRKERRAAWQRLIKRRARGVRLAEEIGLRTQRLQVLLDKLREVSERMDVLSRQLVDLRRSNDVVRAAEVRKELHYLMRITLESPSTLNRRMERCRKLQNEIGRAHV